MTNGLRNANHHHNIRGIRMYIKYKSSFQREILCFYYVKILSLAREKQVRQTKIYSVRFHGVRSFSCRTPTVNHTLLGKNSFLKTDVKTSTGKTKVVEDSNVYD